MLDLPEHAVMVSGLDFWKGVERPIHEERLAAKVSTFLEIPDVKLFAPPPLNNFPTLTVGPNVFANAGAQVNLSASATDPDPPDQPNLRTQWSKSSVSA